MSLLYRLTSTFPSKYSTQAGFDFTESVPGSITSVGPSGPSSIRAVAIPLPMNDLKFATGSVISVGFMTIVIVPLSDVNSTAT